VPEMVIQSHRGPYTVRFGPAFSGLEAGLPPNSHLIIDDKVAELYSQELAAVLSAPSVLRIEATEANKSLEKIPGYVTHLLEKGSRRDHVLVAIGGGITQDITVFIAATILRGVAWRFYPTTLLAQADSCIGSKSSINVGGFKNQMGSFTPPSEVCISADLLDTLDEADIRSGIGEMLKVAVISSWEDTRAIFGDYSKLIHDRQLMEQYTYRSLEIKKEKIEVDEFDVRERQIMNYGHTFGHAIESATDFAIPHGIAVTIGMDAANFLSWQFGLTDRSTFDELHPVLTENYAGFEKTPIPEDRFFTALGNDKKNVGSDISLILLRGPGQLFKDRYPNDEKLRDACQDYFANVLGR